MEEKLKELSRLMGIERESIIEMAVEYFYNEYTSDTKNETEEIKKEYMVQSSALRQRIFSLYNKLSEGNIGKKEAIEEIGILKNMIMILKEMTKLDGDINGFILDSKFKFDYLIRNRELMLKTGADDRNEELARHRINMDLYKAGR